MRLSERTEIGVQTGTIDGIGPHEGTYRKEQGLVRGWGSSGRRNTRRKQAP